VHVLILVPLSCNAAVARTRRWFRVPDMMRPWDIHRHSQSHNTERSGGDCKRKQSLPEHKVHKFNYNVRYAWQTKLQKHGKKKKQTLIRTQMTVKATTSVQLNGARRSSRRLYNHSVWEAGKLDRHFSRVLVFRSLPAQETPPATTENFLLCQKFKKFKNLRFIFVRNSSLNKDK